MACTDTAAALTVGWVLRQGILMNEMNLDAPHAGRLTASFMGFAQPDPSGLVRRFDCKVFAHEVLATAVNYFIGSGSFIRALRLWARQSPTAKKLANQYNGAEGFKLSDKELLPIKRAKAGKGTDDDIATAAPIQLQCETELFSALGLAYVPPNMRFFDVRTKQ